MFLVALDARANWYRYHHLFGEVLQLELGRDGASELRRRAADWCRAHGLVEDAIEYAAAAQDPEMVAELLVEHHLAFVWGGRVEQFLRWARWLPAPLLVEYPVLPAVGAFAAVVVARPEVEVQRLLGMAERARREPRRWSPYVEAVVEVTRAGAIDRGDVSMAVEHGRRAVAAARAGAGMLTVGVLASLAQSLFFAGDLDETRRIALEAVERPQAPEVPDGYAMCLGLLALIDAEHGRPESAEAWARQAMSFARARLHANSLIASPAHLGLALACAATGRLDEAEREALHGEILRRSPQPSLGHAHALLVLAKVRIARARLGRAASELERAQRTIAEFPIPGGSPRSQPPSHRSSRRLKRPLEMAGWPSSQARPSSPCCEDLQSASPDVKSAASSTSRSTRSRPTPASCTAAWGDVAGGGGRPRRDARPARPQ